MTDSLEAKKKKSPVVTVILVLAVLGFLFMVAYFALIITLLVVGPALVPEKESGTRIKVDVEYRMTRNMGGGQPVSDRLIDALEEIDGITIEDRWFSRSGREGSVALTLGLDERFQGEGFLDSLALHEKHQEVIEVVDRTLENLPIKVLDKKVVLSIRQDASYEGEHPEVFPEMDPGDMTPEADEEEYMFPE